jgi:tRNA A-37 threonylcarbamoyl transferase component Bud32
MYFVNWQRDIKIDNRDGQKVVLKSDKKSKTFHEYLLASAYTLVSITLGHPDPPPIVGEREKENEGNGMRRHLRDIGIRTPKLISLSESLLVEEYIGCRDLYRAFLDLDDTHIITTLAAKAGSMTASLHVDGKVFLDNKSQNYLLGDSYDSLYRTDLGFIQSKTSVFSQSMDVATFLASTLDLNLLRYSSIENGFHQGYSSIMKHGFPYLSLILRNIIAPGFAFNHRLMLKNMFTDSINRCSLVN